MPKIHIVRLLKKSHKSKFAKFDLLSLMHSKLYSYEECACTKFPHDKIVFLFLDQVTCLIGKFSFFKQLNTFFRKTPNVCFFFNFYYLSFPSKYKIFINFVSARRVLTYIPIVPVYTFLRDVHL